MKSKGSRRRLKKKRKQLHDDIDSYLHTQNCASTASLVNASDKDLFAVDTSGQSVKVGKHHAASTQQQKGHPLVRLLSLPKKRGIVKRVKPRSKSAQASQKAEEFFDVWAESVHTSKLKLKPDPDAPTIWKGDRVPKLGKGPRPRIPAVVIDAPGCSFNPDPLQHKEMLVKKEHYQHMRQKKPSAVADIDALHQDTLLDELEQFTLQEAEVSESEEEGEEPKIIHRPKIPEKKTRAQRNKQERHKNVLKKHEEMKRMRKVHAQINNAREINRGITRGLEQMRLNGLHRKAENKKLERRGLRRLGGRVIYNSPLEVLGEGETAVACLRLLHGSNDMALHCYASLQKRGLIETGRFRGRKNKKRYRFQNRGLQKRRLEEAKEEIPDLQKRVQTLHTQLQQIKLQEGI